MSSERKQWQAPAISVKSVSEALGSGETAGPMAPGLVAGPNSKFGPPESIAGSSGGNFVALDWNEVTVSGPPTRSAISGPPASSEISSGARGPSPVPAFGPPDRLFHFGPAGSVAASYGPPVFAPLEGPPVPSDMRLKEDITSFGTSAAGFPLYTFRYRGQQGLYQGVMAQDIVKTRPDAVIVDADGFYRVDYAKLGVEFRRVQ